MRTHQHPFDVTPSVHDTVDSYDMERWRFVRWLVGTKHDSDKVELKPIKIEVDAEGVAI